MDRMVKMMTEFKVIKNEDNTFSYTKDPKVAIDELSKEFADKMVKLIQDELQQHFKQGEGNE